ncbi:multinuclear nonheme iron-dependent oxidase [Streptomyces niveiscabiei]|uniref:multinuclear nonheme iron-dependent oxidase n=1 Tax=Streptomyces niveiscabiei TaxID=164115 RepID=UPI003EBA4FBD
MPGVDWVEAVAENLCPGHLPESLQRLRARGVTVVPHGVSLGLGGAERPDEGRLKALAERVEALGSPLVTEHIAFVRAGGALTATAALEAGHLLPVPKTRDALDVLCENIRIAQDALPVPLAVENIAALLAWPGEEMTEGQFLYDLVDRTGVRLLIDVANLHTNHVNRGEDPFRALAELPVEAIAYVHVAGGIEKDGVWHDTHAHPVPPAVLSLLTGLTSRTSPPGVLLERDDNFPDPTELTGELEAIREAVSRGSLARTRTETLAAVRPTAMARAGVHTTAGAASSAGTLPAPSAAARPTPLTTTPPATSAATPLPEARPTPPEEAPPTPRPTPEPTHLPATPARQRLALAQTSLLSALVAGTPAPEGFDRARLAVQARALAAKRAGVVAKVAPELPEILGDKYRPAFLAYAGARPLRGGYRQDALEFAEHLLQEPELLAPRPRRALRSWWLDRSGPAPRNQSRLARTVRALTGR